METTTRGVKHCNALIDSGKCFLGKGVIYVDTDAVDGVICVDTDTTDTTDEHKLGCSVSNFTLTETETETGTGTEMKNEENLSEPLVLLVKNLK